MSKPDASENNKKPVNLEDVYGSNVYLTTDMTSVIILWKTPENDREVEVIPVKIFEATYDEM